MEIGFQFVVDLS